MKRGTTKVEGEVVTNTRTIRNVFRSRPIVEGAGVHLKRAFGHPHVPQFDPFLLLDDFHSSDPQEYMSGFPWHPHRGIETITYVLHGEVEHGDSMGNSGLISAGDVQWMTAGNGIIHQEMPKGDSGGLLWGFQLWANLPAGDKMMHPRYRDVTSDQIPEVVLDNGVRVRIVCGQLNGVDGPARDIVIEPEYLDITVPPATEYRHTVTQGHTVFAYVINGRGLFQPMGVPRRYELEEENHTESGEKHFIGVENVVLFEDGAEIAVSAHDGGLRFLLISGKPIGEPVAWRGPIVMNTDEELRVAFEEYHRGIFLKHGKA